MKLEWIVCRLILIHDKLILQTNQDKIQILIDIGIPLLRL
jgi:hypothetical protein